MAETFDLKALLTRARELSHGECDLYGEIDWLSEATALGKIEDTRACARGGVVLHGKKRGQKSVKNISDLLDSYSAPPRGESERNALVSQLFRQFSQDATFGENLRIRYRDRMRRYFLAPRGESAIDGTEEEAELSIEWKVDRGDGPKSYLLHRARRSIAGLLEEIRQADTLRTRALEIQEPKTLWPSPSGEIRLLFSAEAFASLVLCFLRGFEGDLFLNTQSFLAHAKGPLPLPFDVEDHADGLSNVDHEGSPRKRRMLFVEGQPKGLACNAWVANQLSVPSTGHCRRDSYLKGATVGFWSLKVLGQNVTTELLKTLDQGLLVQSLEILSFHPASTKFRARLKECYLVHQGQKGERTTPLELSIDLIDLLSACEVFSDRLQATAFPLYKGGVRFLTELETPAALTRPIPVSGEVSANTYW